MDVAELVANTTAELKAEVQVASLRHQARVASLRCFSKFRTQLKDVHCDRRSRSPERSAPGVLGVLEVP